jgi:hypothetical protein
MRTTLAIALVLTAAACHTPPSAAGYGPRGDPMSTQAPVSSSGGTSAPEAAAEHGEQIAPSDQTVRPVNTTGPCMYEPASGRYAVCNHMTNDGTCSAYGAGCGPGEMGAKADVQPCMFDVDQDRYSHCQHITTDGKCAAYGSACGPDDLRPGGGESPCLFDATDGRMKTCDHVTTDGKCAAFGGWCQP